MDVSFRGRAGVGLAVPLGAVVLLLSGVLDSLAPTPRGLILVAAGVTLLGVVLPLQLRTRALLKHGAKVQGTVVDVEEDTERGYDNLPSRTYHPVVEFTTAAAGDLHLGARLQRTPAQDQQRGSRPLPP